MHPVGIRSSEGMTCTKCGKRASFLSPIGALCPTDALLAAAFHEWIPEPLANFADTSWLETQAQVEGHPSGLGRRDRE